MELGESQYCRVAHKGVSDPLLPVFFFPSSSLWAFVWGWREEWKWSGSALGSDPAAQCNGSVKRRWKTLQSVKTHCQSSAQMLVQLDFHICCDVQTDSLGVLVSVLCQVSERGLRECEMFALSPLVFLKRKPLCKSSTSVCAWAGKLSWAALGHF